MSKINSFLRKIEGAFFSKEKEFPYLRIYRVLGIPFVIDARKKIRKGLLQKNKVVFWSHFNHFTCNPKYIALALKAISKNLDIVWVAPSKNVNREEFPKDFRVISDLKQAAAEISSARVFVANQRTQHWLRQGVEKKEGQLFIQTWHGSLGIKKTGADRLDLDSQALKNAEFDSSLIDVILSNGRYSTELYSRIFCNKGVIAEVGFPRNDIFFKNVSSNFKKSYNIKPETRIVLYAPTWRERKNQRIEAFDPNSVTRALESRFGGEWQFVYRVHHLQKKTLNMEGIDVSEYPDIQEILVDADVLITDYSSCIYDFVLTKKPGFIFATDRVEYENSRGLYYPLEKTPFSVAENQETLVQNILKFDNDKYLKKVNLFLQEKGCREDGNSAEKVAEFIVNFLEKNEKDFSLLIKAREFR